MQYTENQQKIIDHRGGNLLVSAGAGSGKTMVLTERVIGLITDREHPVDLDNLLIVTFTKAAAAEMKSRIDKRLCEYIEENPGLSRLARQRALLPRAEICTIDSFCARVVKDNISFSDLDPDYRMGDSVEIDLIKQKVFDELAEELFAAEDEAFYDLIDICTNGKNLDEIFGLVNAACQKASSQKDPYAYLNSLYDLSCFDYEDVDQIPAVSYYIGSFKKEIGLLLGNLKEYVSEYSDQPFCGICEQDVNIVEAIASAGTTNELLKALNLFGGFSRIGSSEKYPKSLSDYRNLRKYVKETIDDFKNKSNIFGDEDLIKKTYKPIRAFISFTLEFYRRFTLEKQKQNVLDFDDIEHTALDILSNNPGICEEYKNRYYEVMVDEYQDSNELQECILTLVSRKDNYFMVGDVKQSIYGFRNADPGIFLSKYDSSSYDENACDRKIDLLDNFRCRQEVIDSVNEIFNTVMTKQLGGIDYRNNAKLVFGSSVIYGDDTREENRSEYIRIIGTEKDNDAAAEAEVIAKKIQTMIAADSDFTIYDTDLRSCRKPVYKDFAILVQKREDMKTLIDCLGAKGIPAVVDKMNSLFSGNEVRTVVNYLKIIDNPRQDIPLGGVLLSPMGGFTEDELAKLKASSKASELYDVIACSDDEKCTSFIALLEKYRKYNTYMNIYDLLDELLDETGYYYYTRSLKGGLQKAHNLQALLEAAKNYCDSSFGGVFDFIRYVETIEKRNSSDASAGSVSAGNAVTVATIHGSKGLEYPVVFLPLMKYRFNKTDDKTKIVSDEKYGIAMNYVNVQNSSKTLTLSKRSIINSKNEEAFNEKLRLLYVAMTRAREKLIVISSMKNVSKDSETVNAFALGVTPGFLRSSGSYSSLLDKALAVSSSKWQLSDIYYIPGNSEAERSGEENTSEQQSFCGIKAGEIIDKEIADTIEASLSKKYDRSLGKIKSAYSVSELKKASYGEISDKETAVSHIYTGERSEAAKLGTAYHLIFEKLTLSGELSADIIKGVISDCAQKALIEEDIASKIRPEKILAFFDDPIGKRVIKAYNDKCLYREKPFVLGISPSLIDPSCEEQGNVIVQGVIDLYMIENGKITLIDYKTDYIGEDQTMVLVDRYRKQLRFYAKALEAAYCLPVTEKHIYSITLERFIEADQ